MGRLGIDVGGTFVKFYDGKRRWKVRTPNSLKRLIDLIEKESKGKKVALAIAGLIDQKEKVVSQSPNLPFIEGARFKELLGEDVVIVNDATAACYGEYRLGAAKGSSLAVCLTLGTGLGGGAVINGTPLTGALGCAMEVGHITVEPRGWRCHCGRRGCLESYVSSYGLERLYFIEADEYLPSYRIIKLINEKEENALKAFKEFMRYLTIGVVNLVHLFNPDTVVLCGGIAKEIPQISRLLEEKVREEALKLPASCVKVKRGELEEFSGAVGAYLLSENVK
ncbi:ROK family protein [Thermovibrio sp.]